MTPTLVKLQSINVIEYDRHCCMNLFFILRFPEVASASLHCAQPPSLYENSVFSKTVIERNSEEPKSLVEITPKSMRTLIKKQKGRPFLVLPFLLISVFFIKYYNGFCTAFLLVSSSLLGRRNSHSTWPAGFSKKSATAVI